MTPQECWTASANVSGTSDSVSNLNCHIEMLFYRDGSLSSSCRNLQSLRSLIEKTRPHYSVEQAVGLYWEDQAVPQLISDEKRSDVPLGALIQ